MAARKVVILGAGIAGLSAAWKLSQRGIQVELIEKESQVGGLCRSIRRDGFTFDLGGHRFLTNDQRLLEEIKLLLGDDLLVRPRTSMIRLRNTYLRYPLSVKELIMKLHPCFAARCFFDYLFTRLKSKVRPAADISVEDWLVHRFGNSIYELFFKIYSTKLWGVSPALLSADWAPQRISNLNLWEVLLRALVKSRNMPKTYASSFYYPLRGIGQIAEAMAGVIERNGGNIHLNSSVKRIYLENNKVNSIVYHEAGVEKIASGDFFISTIPVNEFLGSITPALNEEYMQIAGSMKFRSLRFLNIMFDANQISKNTWIYIPEEDYLLFRIQEPKNWNPLNAPEGNTSLILEISCNEDDAVWKASDREIYERCIADLRQLGLLNGAKVKGYFSVRERCGYPIYDLGYREKNRKVVQFLLKVDNLLSIGRQGLFMYNNMDHSIKMGFFAVRHILDGLPKEEVITIATEKTGFES